MHLNPLFASLIAALSAAAVVLTLAGCSQSVPDAERRDDRAGGRAEHPVAPSLRQEKTRAAPGDGQALQAITPNEGGRGHGTGSGPASGYRFRPLDEDRSAAHRLHSRGHPAQAGVDAPYGEPVDTVPGAMGYRFRPPDEARPARRYQPYSRPAHAWNGTPPGAYPHQQDRSGQRPADIPAGAPYRFRPAEEAQPSRRWSGNYRPMSLGPAQVAGPHAAARIAPDPT